MYICYIHCGATAREVTGKFAGGVGRSLGITKANVSQHLSVLRSCGVVRGRRDGVSIYYSISNPRIVKACALMRDVMEEMLKEQQGLLRRFKKGRECHG